MQCFSGWPGFLAALELSERSHSFRRPGSIHGEHGLCWRTDWADQFERRWGIGDFRGDGELQSVVDHHRRIHGTDGLHEIDYTEGNVSGDGDREQRQPDPNGDGFAGRPVASLSL